jgi:hypothetical protein
MMMLIRHHLFRYTTLTIGVADDDGQEYVRPMISTLVQLHDRTSHELLEY